MTLTPCQGMSGHPQCARCTRLRLKAIMRPVVKLTHCAMFDPKPVKKTPQAPLASYAGKPQR